MQFSIAEVRKGADLYRVGIYDKPKALPPEDQVRSGKYEYSPVPLLPDTPISSNEFLHFLSEHTSLMMHNTLAQAEYSLNDLQRSAKEAPKSRKTRSSFTGAFE